MATDATMKSSAIPAGPFIAIQALLRKEKLFVTAERQAIRDLYMEINETTEELLAASRRARRVHWDMHLFNHQRIGWPEWEMRTKAAAEDITFVDAQMVFEQHTEAYENFIRAIKAKPSVLAECIYKTSVSAQVQDQKFDEMLRSVLFSIHGNFFFPEEEQDIMAIMWELIRLQIADVKERTGYFLRTSSAFTRFFMLYSKEYSFQGSLYLVSALRDPVLTGSVCLRHVADKPCYKVYNTLGPV